jgi:hypothetical protein
MINFLQGAIFLAHIVILLHFLKFWLKTREQIFLLFMFMFSLLALHRIIRFACPVLDDNDWPIYVLRLLAYLFPVYGILGKSLFQKSNIK